MDNTLQKMQEMVSGLDSRINRLRSEVEAAEKERNDVQTAIRVYTQVSGAKPIIVKSITPDAETSKQAARPHAEKKDLILAQLGYGERNGRQPIDIFKSLQDAGISDVKIASLRTTLWRMAYKTIEIGGADGRYWKFEKENTNKVDVDVFNLVG